MALTVDALIAAYRSAIDRIPSLTVTAIADIGSTWLADPATGAIQLDANLTPNEAGAAFIEAVRAIDHALGNPVRPALRLAPEPRASCDDEPATATTSWYAQQG